MKRVLAYIAKSGNVKYLLLIALLFRLVLIPSPGFEADISFWKSWGLAVRDFGIVKALPYTNFNYPTPFAYVLGGMAYVYSYFADPHNFNQFWDNSNLLFLAIAKSLPIAADFGIFAIILWIGKNAKRLNFPSLPTTFYSLLAFLYLLNPLSFFDGALWGQVDSVGVFLFLLANCFVLTKRPMLAGIIYMVSVMTKLQNMIYGPVFFIFVWQYLGFNGLLKAAAGSLATFMTMNAEFIGARDMKRVFGDLTGNYDYFPWLSLNAYNVWWIVSGAKGMLVSDKIAFIGMANAKTVGLFMFSATYLLSVLTMLKGRFLNPDNSTIQQCANDTNQSDPILSREIIFRYLSGLIIAAGGFFLFQTQSHDRYAFPISIFLLLWAPFWIVIKNKVESAALEPHLKRLKSFIVHYIFFTILYFYNIHNAMIANYPNNGIPFLSGLNIPPLTIAASFLQIGLFLYFLYVLRRHITAVLFTIWVGVFILLVTSANLPLILKKPVPITKLTPVITTTGYGRRQVNMPVQASFGFSKWGALSVQYAFYRHGLGTHAPSREVFDINGLFRTLSTDYGVDTNGGPQATVEFVIYGDGKQLFASGLVKRFEFPRHVEVDITGVKSLELIVTDGGNGNFDDHADWLNTYLIP
jgi:hypothetical protein